MISPTVTLTDPNNLLVPGASLTPSTSLTPTDGVVPVDLTSRLELSQAVTITRGRQDQLNQLTAGTCTLTLDNSDGGLDKYVASGTRYPIQIGSASHGTRFTGWVDQWVQGWPGGGNNLEWVQVTCSDLWADLERQGSEALSWQTITSYNPVCFYALTEGASTDPRAFDQVPPLSPDMVPYQLGNAGAITWGQGVQAPLDGSGIVRFDPSTGTVGWYLQTETPISLSPSSNPNSAWTVHCVVNTATTWQGVLWTLQSTAAASYSGQTSGTWVLALGKPGSGVDLTLWQPTSSGNYAIGAGTTGTVASGQPVPVTVTYDGGNVLRFWVKEQVYQFTPDPLPTMGTDYYLTAGGARQVAASAADYAGQISLLSGALGNLAVWDSVLTDAQIVNLVRSELYGITDDPQKAMQRWLGWWSGQSPDVGAVTSPTFDLDAPTTAGVTWKTTQTGSISTLLREGEQTEGGSVFVDRAGAVQFLARHTTRTLPSLTIDAELVDPSAQITSDWRFAVESATATSTSGDNYRYNLGTGTGTNTSIVSLATNSDEVRYATQWAVNGNQTTTKLPSLTIDLGTLDDTTASSAAALDIGSTLTIQRVPSRPASDPYQVLGYTETFTHADWSMAFNVTTLGDGSIGDLLIWDDPTFGVWDSTHGWDW